MSFFSWSLLVFTWFTPVAVRDAYAPSENAAAAASLCLVEDVSDVVRELWPLDGLGLLVRLMTRLLRGVVAVVLVVTVLRSVIVVDATYLSEDVIVDVTSAAACNVVYTWERYSV